MIKRSVTLLLAILLALSLVAGCGGATSESKAPAGGPDPKAEPKAQASQPVSKQTTYPLKLKDYAGREVTIEKEPQRILSLAPSKTEVLFAIGAGGKIVGRTDYCDFPAEAKQIQSVGGIVKPEYEKILATRPDLVFMIGGSLPVREKLAGDLKLNVFVVDPKNLEQVYEAIKTVGQIVNKQEEAEKTVAEMQTKVKAITAKVGTVPAEKRPKVFYEVWNNPVITAGPNTFINDLIKLAGGVNIGEDADKPWPEYPLEKIVQHNPEIIITPIKQSFDELKAKQRKGWEGVRAIAETKVYLVEDTNLVSRPGPRLVLGLEYFARTLHPEAMAR